LFEERQLLLSLLLSIPKESVVNNRSSPHRGEPGLTLWINSFLQPLNGFWGQGTSSSEIAPAKCVKLAVVKKKSDFKVYRRGEKTQHYSDYLKSAYPWLIIVDLGAELTNEKSTEEYGSSQLPLSSTARAITMPALMMAAEVLVNGGAYLTAPHCRLALSSIVQEYGT